MLHPSSDDSEIAHKCPNEECCKNPSVFFDGSSIEGVLEDTRALGFQGGHAVFHLARTGCGDRTRYGLSMKSTSHVCGGSAI